MNRSRPVALFALVSLLVIAAGSTAFAKTIHVGPGGDYAKIQDAIAAPTTVDGDVVVVAQGTYKERINFKGKAITVQSTNPTDKAVVAATIVDGNQKGSVVTFKSGEKATPVLDGFTLTNGSATRGGGVDCEAGSSPILTHNTISGNSATYGGGVYCDSSSSPTLTHNTISHNSAGNGGGVYCYQHSSPTLSNNTIRGNSAACGGGVECFFSGTLTHNTISGNSATSGGGGVWCDGSLPTLTNNTISGNSATNGRGGGVYCDYSSPTLTNNTISGNSATCGGGVWCDYSSPTLTGNTISGNSVTADGGGVGCSSSSPVLTSNTLSNNSAQVGGGVFCYDSSPNLTSNTISGNSATVGENGYGGFGGGVSCFLSTPTLTNNTISGNSATAGGGVYCQFDSSLVIKNTIIAFSAKGAGLYVDVTEDPGFPSEPVITYCDLYGSIGGDYKNWPKQTGKNGNISQDPLFANAAGGDLHEKSKGGRWNPESKTWVKDTVQSPCIDAGDPTSPFSKEPAPNGGRINMGDYGNTRQASKSAPAGSSGVVSLTATAATTASGLAQITVNLTSAASVQVSVLNLAGREVAVLPPQDLPEGLSTLLWNGRSTSGTTAPAGRYLVRVTARTQDGGQAQALAGLTVGR